MDHVGIRPTHVNNFVTTWSIPHVDPKSLRSREKEIGPVIEAVAEASCQKVAKEEAQKTDPSQRRITMSYDMGW